MSHLLPLDPSIDFYGSAGDAQWPYQRADEQPRPDHDASYELQYPEDSPDDSSLSPTETVFYQHQYYPGFVTQSGFPAQDSHASPPSEAYAEEPYGTRETYYADELNQPPLQYASYPAHAPPFARADPQQMASILASNQYLAPSYGAASQFQELVAASGGLAVAATQGHAVNEPRALHGAHWPEGPAAAAAVNYERSSLLTNPGYDAIPAQQHQQAHVSPVFVPQAADSSGNHHESYGNHSGGDSPMGHLPYADTELPFTNLGQYQQSAEHASPTSASSSSSFIHFHSESPSIKQEEVDTTADFARVSASRMHADTLKLHASTLPARARAERGAHELREDD
ncbi:hypothetical protein EWM64_g3899 [Hericium alpestre]|uniref:Uncharacterized protein n=1 Tax=Hericium alpestre TaxID=135208 RepID=A0A4Z0A064_9AGAM|nr:hypothetical protein EWM64_g3899 [Hericium alpestre]